MPELPEVETVRRGLAPTLEGAVIDKVELRRDNLRFAFPENFRALSEGQIVIALGRRAKYLLMDLQNGQCVIMHLGMSGSFRIKGETGGNGGEDIYYHERHYKQAHDHVVFHVTTALGQERQIIYNDPRRFGFMLLWPRAMLDDYPPFQNMGVEPLGNQLHGGELAERLGHKKTAIKAALLDQRVVAGLGNIYVCEALWRAGIAPDTKAMDLVLKSGKPTKRLNALALYIGDVISEAIRAGGSSLRDHAKTDGTLGYFQHQFAVYDREGKACCKQGCEGQIQRMLQGGRSTFYCPCCQQ